MSRKPPHDLALSLAQGILEALLPADLFCRIQSAITTGDSEPEPDVAVVIGPRRRYADHHPGPGDISMVIEIADSSLAEDREVKGRIYSRADISVYWIVNLLDRQVEVFELPAPSAPTPAYQKQSVFQATESVPVQLLGVQIGEVLVAELLP